MLGDSPVALRLLPALAGALVVVLAGLMARELGSGRFAQGLAALATFVAPNFIVMGTFLSMDAFDQLFWVSGTYVLLLILKRDKSRLWLLFGLIVGLGLLTKLSMLFFGFAVLVALLLTPARRHLLTPWPWLGGVIGIAFLLPYVFWQIEHSWPILEFWGNYGEKVDPASPVEFLVEQIVTMHPLTLPIWLAGLYYYLFSSTGRPYRSLGWIYVVLFVLFVIQNAKFYFLAPAYPMLFAAGALAIERFIGRRGWGWIRPVYAAALAVGGIVVAPLVAVPALPVETLAKITGAAGGDAGWRWKVGKWANSLSSLLTGSAGRLWWQPLPGSTVIFRRKSKTKAASSPATTERLGPSIFSAQGTIFPRLSAGTTTTTSGDLDPVPAKSLSPLVFPLVFSKRCSWTSSRRTRSTASTVCRTRTTSQCT